VDTVHDAVLHEGQPRLHARFKEGLRLGFCEFFFRWPRLRAQRTEATIQTAGGAMFRVTKGAAHAVCSLLRAEDAGTVARVNAKAPARARSSLRLLVRLSAARPASPLVTRRAALLAALPGIPPGACARRVVHRAG
jgi:hypothetical protein